MPRTFNSTVWSFVHIHISPRRTPAFLDLTASGHVQYREQDGTATGFYDVMRWKGELFSRSGMANINIVFRYCGPSDSNIMIDTSWTPVCLGQTYLCVEASCCDRPVNRHAVMVFCGHTEQELVTVQDPAPPPSPMLVPLLIPDHLRVRPAQAPHEDEPATSRMRTD